MKPSAPKQTDRACHHQAVIVEHHSRTLMPVTTLQPQDLKFFRMSGQCPKASSNHAEHMSTCSGNQSEEQQAHLHRDNRPLSFGHLVCMPQNGSLMISLDAHLEQPEVVAEQLIHYHSQSEDVCFLIVLLPQQDLQRSRAHQEYSCMDARVNCSWSNRYHSRTCQSYYFLLCRIFGC